MGGYQLSLQGDSYNPLSRLEGIQQKNSSNSITSADSSSRGKKLRSNSPSQGLRFFQAKRGESQQNLESLLQATPPRHSTACCDGVSERREVERRLSSQKLKVGAAPVSRDSENGDSFRSEDSESLALWEKEPASTDHGWVKLTAQSPRWLDAMRRFGRSSPVHPKSPRDIPLDSLDRNPSQRSSHDSSKSWYSTAAKMIRNGESRSVRSPRSASNLTCQSGELYLSICNDDSLVMSGDSKDGSFSLVTREDTLSTASAVARDISVRQEALAEKATSPVNALPLEIPAEGLPEMAEIEKLVDANSAKDAQSVTDKLMILTGSEGHISRASNEGRRCKSFVDGQSESVICRTFAEDELAENDSRLCKDKKSTGDAAEFVNVIDFVAPLLTKPQSMEKTDDSSATVRTKSHERRVPFKWEAPQGKQLRADEVAPATETPQPRPFATKDGVSSAFESLREQYIIKTSARLDGFSAIVPKTSQSGITKPRPPRAPTSTIKEDSVAPDLFLTKSRSTNDAKGPLRRAYNSPDHRLFTKLRKSVFGGARGPSPLGPKNVDLGGFIDSSSPRSILRGPDDGSVPSSNPSLRSDPGTPAFSAVPTSNASQPIPSRSASFDLNDAGGYEMTYDLNSTAARVIVESRRVSLSFRDFGPNESSGEEMAVKVEDASENLTCNIELVGCNDRFDTNGRSMPEPMQSPELWTATFSRRYQVCDSEPRSDMPEGACAGSELKTEFPAGVASPAIVSLVTDGVPSADQQQVQVPIVIQKSRSRNAEFAARLGVMFSPLRMTSHESNRSCFVAATLSPPHDVDGEDRSPTYSASLEFLSTSELHSSSTKERKSMTSWTNGEMVKRNSSTRRHFSDDSHAIMASISKVVKKILSKCTVKRSTSKGKSKTGPPVLDILPPAGFHFATVKVENTETSVS